MLEEAVQKAYHTAMGHLQYSYLIARSVKEQADIIETQRGYTGIYNQLLDCYDET